MIRMIYCGHCQRQQQITFTRNRNGDDDDDEVIQKESKKKLKEKNVSTGIQRMWNMKYFVILEPQKLQLKD
jgi:hypothetical protein